MKKQKDFFCRNFHIGKWFAFFFPVLLFAIVLFPLEASAKTEEYEIQLDETKENYVFSIQWENTDQQADVVITSPEGKTYTLENMPQAEAGEGELMFWFASAKAGTWKVKITSEGLGMVTLDSGVMPGRMNIASFSVRTSGENGTASWTIQDSEEEITLEIWAAPDPVNYGGEKLTSVRGKASDQCEFSMSSLDSGEYYLYLKAIGTDGIFAVQYANGSVSWRKEGVLPKLDGVQARMLDDDLWISWEEMEDADSYRVLVYDSATGELIVDESVTEEMQWFGEIPDSIDTLTAAVAACSWSDTGDFELHTVTRGNFDGVNVTFPKEEHINLKTVYVEVAFTGTYTVSAALNGEMLMENMNQAGKYRVDMEEGENRISFYVADESGNIRSFGKDLHVDVTAPQLSILRDLNGLSTSENHIYLEGHTEVGAVLTLNGEAVETQNGYFSIRCPLSAGKNQMELLAADAAGNESRYSAVVERPWMSAQILLWIVCIIIAVVLLVVYILLLIRGRRKRT